ncbi:hypothetical protein [Nocardiopsis dassonvillei]|uniref:hypothetical protein n=1 Tax=Nocardiopsis dassonvillei TaxID=2014 RepID=UPI003F542F48
MSTSMPYTTAITVTPTDVEKLRDSATGSCLVWDEASNWVATIGRDQVATTSRMIIAGRRGLEDLAETLDEEGIPVTDERLARDLTDIANDYRTEWPGIRTMNLQVQGLREAVIGPRTYLDGPPLLQVPVTGLPRMTDYYRRTRTGLIACVTVSFAYLEPTVITLRAPREGLRPVTEMAVETAGALRPHKVHRLIAAAVDGALDLDL